MSKTADELFSRPELEAARVFVNKKSCEITPMNSLDAKEWLVRLLRGWCGPKFWNEISTNNRKMEMVFKVWKTDYYGYGLEKMPGKPVLQEFRGRIGVELHKMNLAAQAARQKHLTNKKLELPESGEDAYVDYFVQERAKLANPRTIRKTVVRRKPPPTAPTAPLRQRQNVNVAPPPKAKRGRVSNPYQKPARRHSVERYLTQDTYEEQEQLEQVAYEEMEMPEDYHQQVAHEEEEEDEYTWHWRTNVRN